MTLAPTDLSWTALLAAWRQEAFTVTALRELALAHIGDADADAVVPLSELASLPDTAVRSDATPSLEHLARLHGWPLLFGRREWQVRQLTATLAALEHTPRQFESWDMDVPELAALDRLDNLSLIWEKLGLNEDGPPLVPPSRAAQYAGSLGEYDAPTGQPLQEALEIMQTWIAGQEALLATVSRLWAAGFTAEVHTLAAALEQTTPTLSTNARHGLKQNGDWAHGPPRSPRQTGDHCSDVATPDGHVGVKC